jgi:hypothetical protein
MNHARIASISAAAVAAVSLAAGVPALAQPEQAQGTAIVTVESKHGNQPPAPVPQSALQAKVDGRNATITSWGPDTNPLEVVLLIDSSVRTSVGRELSDMTTFAQKLPPDAKFAIAYMDNGQAYLATPLTTNKQEALTGLHLPAGAPGSSASPYFCLSDLAKRWPSHNPNARREVIMITNGVDNYERRYDPEDPYVQAAITDSVRAGLVVYSIYWADEGFLNRTGYAINTGQNLLTEVAEATGGRIFWQGFSNPVSMQPYFEELNRMFGEQYQLGVSADLKGKPQVVDMRLKVNDGNVKVDAPTHVMLGQPGTER